jgi:hypothetical protein
MGSLKDRLDQQDLKINDLQEALEELKRFKERFKNQFIYERILYGIGGDNGFDYDYSWKFFKQAYDIFGNIPQPPEGATRHYRLHLLYSDDMKNPRDSTEVRIRLYDLSKTLLFNKISPCDAYPSHNIAHARFSNFLEWPDTNGHAQLDIRLTNAGHQGRLFYLGLQAWDFFE